MKIEVYGQSQVNFDKSIVLYTAFFDRLFGKGNYEIEKVGGEKPNAKVVITGDFSDYDMAYVRQRISQALRIFRDNIELIDQ